MLTEAHGINFTRFSFVSPFSIRLSCSLRHCEHSDSKRNVFRVRLKPLPVFNNTSITFTCLKYGFTKMLKTEHLCLKNISDKKITFVKTNLKHCVFFFISLVILVDFAYVFVLIICYKGTCLNT